MSCCSHRTITTPFLSKSKTLQIPIWNTVLSLVLKCWGFVEISGWAPLTSFCLILDRFIEYLIVEKVQQCFWVVVNGFLLFYFFPLKKNFKETSISFIKMIFSSTSWSTQKMILFYLFEICHLSNFIKFSLRNSWASITRGIKHTNVVCLYPVINFSSPLQIFQAIVSFSQTTHCFILYLW